MSSAFAFPLASPCCGDGGGYCHGRQVAANNNDANGVVVPTSSTEDEGTYVDAYVAFEGACFSMFAFVDSS